MSDVLFISPNTSEGLQGDGNVSLAYLYGISDYWINVFEDKDLVESVLETHTHQLSDIYGRFLQLSGNISLATIQEKYQTQISLLLIDETDVVDELLGVTYKLKKPITDAQYLMNRALLPSLTLEKGVHFELSADGTQITFHKPLQELAFPKRPTSNDTEEYAIWASNVLVDEDIIQKEYGVMVNMTPAQAIGNYKSFLMGLYYLYSHGPNINEIEAGLNLALGLPAARKTESVLSIFQDGATGHWIVVTPTQYYDIPYGFRPELVEGDIIYAGQQLASWVEVRDYRKNGDWWINSYIPQELIVGDSFQLGIATEGSEADRIMREYLKNNTFQVLFKQSGVSLDAYNTVRDIVYRVKPTYTYPVFVWQAPVGDEPIDLQEEFTYNLKSSLEDNLATIPIDEFRRDIQNNGFLRGVHRYNRFQVPYYVQRMMGDSPDPMDDIGEVEEGMVLAGVGGWVPDLQYVDDYQSAWLGCALRNRGDATQGRTRSTGIRGYRGVASDSFEELTWHVQSPCVYPAMSDGAPYSFGERRLMPLYVANEDEVQEKFKRVQIAFDVSRGDVQVIRGVNVKSNYNLITQRDPSQILPNIDRDAHIEEEFQFYNAIGDLEPTLSDYFTQCYRPPLDAVNESMDILVAKVYRKTWAVYIIHAPGDIRVSPTYFPVDNDDYIELTAEFDYSTITEEKPAMINRSTAKLESHFLMTRSRPDGAYRDQRSGYTLNINRSGTYGPADKPLRSYKRA